MRVIETIADRRIREARQAGYFDGLPGAGKPIPDLDRERPAGWWAARVVKSERDKLRHEQLLADLRAAKPDLWRLRSQREVGDRVAALNERLAAYNATTSFEPIEALDPEALLGRWRDLQAGAAPRR